MNLEHIKQLEKRLEQIEKRFEDIDTLTGRSAAFDSNIKKLSDDIQNFKEDLRKVKKDIIEFYESDRKNYKDDFEKLKKENKEDYEQFKKNTTEELEEIDDAFRDPEKGILIQLRDINRITQNLERVNKALELKFDTRIDAISPDLRELKTLYSDLIEICGKRLEKLDAVIRNNEKNSQYTDKIINAAISAGFALAVAFLKDC